MKNVVGIDAGTKSVKALFCDFEVRDIVAGAAEKSKLKKRQADKK